MFSLKTDTHTTLAFHLSSVTRAIASFQQEPLCNHLECCSCSATKTHHCAWEILRQPSEAICVSKVIVVSEHGWRRLFCLKMEVFSVCICWFGRTKEAWDSRYPRYQTLKSPHRIPMPSHFQCPLTPAFFPTIYLRGSNRSYQNTWGSVMEIWKKFCSVLIIQKSHFGQGDELRLTSHFSLVVDAFITNTVAISLTSFLPFDPFLSSACKV